MSIHLIGKYYAEVEKIIRYGGSNKETAVRTPFQKLLNEYANQKDLELITELDYKVKETGKTVKPDGTLKDAIRLDWGYWESKGIDSDIDKAIDKKFREGYPKSNILFDNTETAVLIQQGKEVLRCKLKDAEKLDKLLSAFTSFVRPEVKTFREALEVFKKDVPQVLETLREIVESEGTGNLKFKQAQADFLALCRETINPEVSAADVNEMLMQHILTEEIFTSVFEDPQFHQENNISKELHKLEDTFFTGAVKRKTLDKIKSYYAAIKAQAGSIASYTEKQMFLKSIYENFYKVYNPKAADRLGVVYTPNEIVKFMIEGTDYLLHKHFGKLLASKNVEILDPATGTGTFITDLIEYLPIAELPYKYKNEIHCNEVAILPYYIANLNIEATYKAKMGSYEEFQNICFVDTLDNLGFEFAGKQTKLFGFSAENADRVKRQNARKISVIIGNPPYNANQQNENDNNKNRMYPGIDKRIKETFIKYSTAQKTKVYDMYSRFYRWAMDRLDNDGIVCFITNNSFINTKTFDGFRKCVQDEFDHAYIIDLGGNIRELSGKDGIYLNEENTIFGVSAAVGIAIMFLVKKKSVSKLPCNVYYIHPTDIRATRKEKFEFIQANKIQDINFQLIEPDKNNNWINLSDNDFESLLPIASKDVKAKRSDAALFGLYSLGISTNRDEWVSNFSKKHLGMRMDYFLRYYNSLSSNYSKWEEKIKWSRNLKRRLSQGKKESFEEKSISKMFYRPFVNKYIYNSDLCIDEKGSASDFFRGDNLVILWRYGDRIDFCISATNNIPNLNIYGLDPAQYIALYRYTKEGTRIDNLTNWGLMQFTEHFKDEKITKEDVFHYTYGTLHNPAYRIKYEMNLKREFPRIPYYKDFHKWAAWGKELMNLHVNFETVEPYPLRIINTTPAQSPKQAKLIDIAAKQGNQLVEEPTLEYYTPKAKLKTDKEAGQIILDEVTTLSGIPPEAWEYKLGNRSALEWVLDQYKEKKPSDPTILEKFNNYRFADYKDKVIDLLKRVCTVSIETVRIMKEMEKANQS